MDNDDVCCRHNERLYVGTYINTAQQRTVRGTADCPEGESNRRIGEAGLARPGLNITSCEIHSKHCSLNKMVDRDFDNLNLTKKVNS